MLHARWRTLDLALATAAALAVVATRRPRATQHHALPPLVLAGGDLRVVGGRLTAAVGGVR